MSEKIEWIEIGSPSYVEGNFGQAVSVDATNKIQTKNPVTFGGADFTIDFWANVASFSIRTAGNIFYATSKSSEYLRLNHAKNSAYFYFEAYDGINLLSNNASLVFPSNTWKHFEFCYKHETGNGYIFLDGKRRTITTPTQNRRIERLARTITLGGLPCLFEEFRILDGVCLHTEDFDAPTAPYELTGENMSEGILKFPVGNEYKEILSERPADVVNYSGTSLANALGRIGTEKIPHVETVETAEKTEKDLSGNVLTDFYLTLNNAEMTGTPTAPEYDGTDTAVNQIATCGYFNGLVRKCAGSTDATVAKIIAALNGDPNFATTTATKIDAKQSKTTNLTALNKLGSETGIILATSSDTLTTFSATETGKKILVASDFENFRGIIQAPTAETFLWDETEKVHWEKVGSPYLSTDNAKFSKALQCSSGNYVQSTETITFGGDPFTVDAWLYYVNDTTAGQNKVILNLGDFKVVARAGDNSQKALCIYDSSNNFLLRINDWGSTDSLALKKLHLEICYSSGTLYFFINGSLTKTLSRNVSRAARQIILGGATCLISEFRILDGVCLHTGNFLPPPAQYELTDETISLLHFDKSY